MGRYCVFLPKLFSNKLPLKEIINMYNITKLYVFIIYYVYIFIGTCFCVTDIKCIPVYFLCGG